MAFLPLEEEEVNPVQHRLHLSTSDYVRTLVLGLTLLPFRLCGLLSCFILAWAVSSVGLIGADLSRPLEGWRAFARWLVACLGRLSMFCCGFHRVQVNPWILFGHHSICAAGGAWTALTPMMIMTNPGGGQTVL